MANTLADLDAIFLEPSAISYIRLTSDGRQL